MTTETPGGNDGVSSKALFCIDDDGQRTRAGDAVCFCYGIPPVGVRAQIIQRDGKLVALTPGHKPAECDLRSLRKYVGGWYRQNKELTDRP